MEEFSMRLKNIFVTFFLFFILLSTQANAANEDSVIVWNQAILNLIQAGKTPPPIAARTLAITHTGIYNAWAAFDAKAEGTTRGGTLRRPLGEWTDSNKQEAISFAAYRILLNLFPQQSLVLTNLMNLLGYDPAYTTFDPATPGGIGNIVADDILNLRHFDGSNQLGNEPVSNGLPYSDYTGYKPINTPTDLVDPNRWQPLIVNGIPQQFLLPQWGLVQPFALQTAYEFFPEIGPAKYPDSNYTKQANAVLKLSAELNDYTKSIASYWADGSGTVTPPGHWNQFAQFVSNRDHQTLDQNAKMFFILNNALLDAGIAVWFVKTYYDSERPITAIHFLYNNEDVLAWAGPGLGTQVIKGQNWQSYIGTPPFAEYVSGHSTFSRAAAEVLKLFTGSNFFGNFAVIPKGSSPVEPGLVPATDIILSWKTFTDAADQAGISRRYGGIHFKDGDHEGRKMGKKIGKANYQKCMEFINGVTLEESSSG